MFDALYKHHAVILHKYFDLRISLRLVGLNKCDKWIRLAYFILISQ